MDKIDKMRLCRLLGLITILVSLVACGPAETPPIVPPAQVQQAQAVSLVFITPDPDLGLTLPGPTPLPTFRPPTSQPTTPPTATSPPVTPTPIPTAAPSATPTLPPLPTAIPTSNATELPPINNRRTLPTITPQQATNGLVLCVQRVPTDDLYTIVTRDFPLSRDYTPNDLVDLSDFFNPSLTLKSPLYARAVIVEPLYRMLGEMQTAGLQPTIISAYRSYSEQSVAWNKWTTIYPDRGNLLSAVPGTSEHQLGTTIDIGSPEIDNEFHTNFGQTAEGAWLLENAHWFGFTLSYPADAFEITQFTYEPWHYRYVGTELATQLKEANLTLTEYQLTNFAQPCLP